jgi:hypothetical protein
VSDEAESMGLISRFENSAKRITCKKKYKSPRGDELKTEMKHARGKK